MASNTEFVVMTINAAGGSRARQTQLDPKQIATDLSKLISATIGTDSPIGMPDIIAVQESHQVWIIRGGDAFLETSRELAQRLGSSYSTYFSEYLDSDSHAHRNKWRQPAFYGFGRVKQGNAVITNKSLAQWPWDLPPRGYPGYNRLAPAISTQISRATLYSTGNRDTEPRNLIVVPLSLGQEEQEEQVKKASLYFMATHLTTLNEEKDKHGRRKPTKRASKVRRAQVHEILRVVDELRKAERNAKQEPIPIILAGDFNATPGSLEINDLERTFERPNPRWCDGSDYHGEVWTHVKHRIHVDHVFYDDPNGLLTRIDCCVLGLSQVEEVTDHFPVVAKFKFK